MPLSSGFNNTNTEKRIRRHTIGGAMPLSTGCNDTYHERVYDDTQQGGQCHSIGDSMTLSRGMESLNKGVNDTP